MNQARRREVCCRVLTGISAALFFLPVLATDVYKADNALPLNEPLSWEGGVAPGVADVAVFDERVTASRLGFLLTNDLAWAGVVFTNQTTAFSSMIGTATFSTNGAAAATLTLGTNGVCLAGSGLALTLNTPLALSAAQTWQLDRRNLTFGGPVSGASEWVLNMPSQTVWNVASGFSGNLTVSNSFFTSRFNKAGRWAKTFALKGGGRWEMAFGGSALWSDLFMDRTAAVTCWNGLTSGGTLQFEEGDTFLFPGNRFTLDNGYAVQNGGALSGFELQVQYSTYNARHTVSGGSLALTGGLLIGNGLSSLANEGRFLQTGGLVAVNSIKAGWNGCKFWGLNTFEMTGGVFRITGARGADSGVHLSWNEGGNSLENSGLFLMKGGWADIDQVAFGRSQDGAAYATTNAFSMAKMTGGELVLGSRGFYAGRSWNNGIPGSAYAVKLQGGTLTAGDSWSSALDLFLGDANGGTAFNTADTNGVGQRVVLNGAVYGPGKLAKVGAGTLVLAGEAAYAGKTVVEEGTLAVGATAAASDCCRWIADSVADTNNAPVATWADVNGGVPATNSAVSQTPRLIRSELNGHSVVRFSGGASQYLAVEAAKSPISGATNFSIAVVFKTGSAGAGSASHWYQNTGLVDAEQGGIQNDWGMGYNGSGQVGGGAGFPSINKDATVYSASGYSVADNQPHAAIFTWQGTNLTMNVDGRVTEAASTATSVSPRSACRMLFGSMNNLVYFNGDIAEIRIYRNRALSPDEQNAVGSELSATYGVPGAVFSESAPVAASAGEVTVLPAADAAEPLPYDAAVWDADTLTGTNGSAVNAWASTNGARAATLAGVNAGGVTAPALLAGALNGHNAVRFSGALKTGLGIPAGESPVAGSTNFTVAFVFRAAEPGKSAPQWYSSIGVIDAEQPGGANDWGLAFSGDGRVAAGIGNADVTSLSKLFDLHDGMPHVVVVSYDMARGNVWMMADGLCSVQSVGAHLAPRNAYRIVLGSLNALNGQFFSGDLAAFRFLPERVLSEAEMTSLSKEMGAKYGVRLVSRGNTLSPQATGLGRGDVEVCAGAALVLPAATHSAVTLAAGQTISGGGAVRGTLALSAGATVDVGSSETLTLDRLWLGDGATVRWHHVGGVGSTLGVGTLKTAGTARLLVEGGGDALPVRARVMSFQSGEGLAETVWTVVGGARHSRVEIDVAAKTVDVVTPMGTMILVR